MQEFTKNSISGKQRIGRYYENSWISWRIWFIDKKGARETFENEAKEHKMNPKFNCAYSRHNLLKRWAYAKNLDEYKLIAPHWLFLYEHGDYVTYFDSFEVEYIPKEI